MKLNNNGWGLKEMMIISSILLMFLLFAAYYIWVLYSDLSKTRPSVYNELEYVLQSSAERYLKKQDNKSDRVVVSLKELQTNGYLITFTDPNDEDCNGYVIYDSGEYNSYISCEFYTTSGYKQKYE